MASPKRVSNQVFKLKTPEQPCATAQILGPQVEALDGRVTFLETTVLHRLEELTTRVNNMTDRCGRLA